MNSPTLAIISSNFGSFQTMIYYKCIESDAIDQMKAAASVVSAMSACVMFNKLETIDFLNKKIPNFFNETYGKVYILNVAVMYSRFFHNSRAANV